MGSPTNVYIKGEQPIIKAFGVHKLHRHKIAINTRYDARRPCLRIDFTVEETKKVDMLGKGEKNM